MGNAKGVGVRPRGYWSDPTWRLIRITTLVTAPSTLVVLALYLWVAKSLLDLLTTVVILNLITNFALLVDSWVVWTRRNR